jgi:hypothetical protein
MAVFNFDEAAQNVAYVGLTFPEAAGATTDDAVEELLEPPHEARSKREAMMSPVERERLTSFLRICPTCCGDLNG